MKTTLIDTVDVKNTLGEGVTWDHRTGNVLWTDVFERRLFILNFDTRELSKFELPEMLTSFGLTTNPDILVCAFSDGFYLLHIASRVRQVIAEIESDYSGTRMNDGRLDPAGRFWAGSMLEGKGNVPNERGSLYSLDGEIRKHLSNIEISNGLAWSPDGQLMYFADSAKNEVFVLDYDLKSGTCCNKQRHIKTTKSEFPDGGTVDSEGNYWSAIWGAGEVRQYNKSGKLLQSISVPTTQASCVAFGGPDMRYLFVTSARKNLSTMLLKNEPEAGNVFIFKTDVQGLQITMPYKLTSNKFTFTTRG